MKKSFSILFLAILIVLSACGKEDASPEAKENESLSNETDSGGNESAELPPLEIVKKNEQVGNQPFPGSSEESELNILEEGERTYVIEREANSHDTKFKTSVVKNNEWETTARTSEVKVDLPEINNSEIIESKDSLLGMYSNKDSNTVVIYKLSLDPSGEISSDLLLSLDISEYYDASLLHGTDGKAYIYVEDADDSFVIYDDKGNRKFEFKNENDLSLPVVYSFNKGTLLDVDKNVLYFAADFDGKPEMMIDLDEGDFVWDESGKEKLYDMKNPDFRGIYKPNETSLYDVSNSALTSYSLNYSLMGEDELINLGSVELGEGFEHWNVKMVVGKKEIHVYAFVVYKGQRTLQQYTVNRID